MWTRAATRPHQRGGPSAPAVRADVQREAGLLALQRSAGNQAVVRLLQREVTGSPAVTDVSFTVGKEITAGFATAARAAVADGHVDDKGLEAMRQAALADDQSVNDDERMFMAGVLDPANARRLHALRSFAAAPDTISFSASSISPERRARIRNLDRPAMPADVTGELALADRAAKAIGADIAAGAAATVAH